MPAENIINQAGPLPIQKEISPEYVGSATLVVAGSVWTQTTDAMIGFKVLFEGQEVGVAEIWSNGPATHRAVVPQHIPISLTKAWKSNGVDQPPAPAAYSVELQPMNGDTTSDYNDRFTVMLVEG